jgi:hypothetical protein
MLVLMMAAVTAETAEEKKHGRSVFELLGADLGDAVRARDPGSA